MISLDRTRSDRDDDDCLSDLTLDKARVGELASEAIAAHLESCALCRDRQRALTQAHDAVELPPIQLPPLQLPPLQLPPRAKPRRRWARAGAAGLAIAAAALLVVIVQPGDPSGDPSGDLSGDPSGSPSGLTPPTHEPTTRTKGAPTLHFHIRRDGTVLEGGPGELLRPGDALRFAYSWSEGGTIAVISRDGAGTVSTYFPEGEHTFAAAPGEQIDLPGAVLLDGVLGEEVLYGVFCADEVALRSVERAIDARPDDPSVAGCVIDRIRVDKRAAP